MLQLQPLLHLRINWSYCFNCLRLESKNKLFQWFQSYSAAQFTTTGTLIAQLHLNQMKPRLLRQPLVPGVTNSAAISTSTDVDYYKITTTAASNIVYNLVGPSGVDYDLYIYNSAGTQIGQVKVPLLQKQLL